MPLACPCCQKEIPVSSIRSAFVCPFCQEPMRTNHGRVVCAALFVGALAEITLFFILRSQFGSLALAFYTWGIFAGVSAYLIYNFSVRYFVELLHVK